MDGTGRTLYHLQHQPVVYEGLRARAEARRVQEKPGDTLWTTALAHEECLRLADVKEAQRWNSRGHYFGAVAEAMRRMPAAKGDRSDLSIVGASL